MGRLRPRDAEQPNLAALAICTATWTPSPSEIQQPGGSSDLLRAWCDGELGLALESMSQRLLGHSCRTPHVLIAGVGAAADQTWCIVEGGRAGVRRRQ